MDEHPPNPPPAGALRRGLYLDAKTTGPGSAHDRLAALALLPFTFDAEARIVEILTGEALCCPNPHRPRSVAHGAGAGDAWAPGIDLAAASTLIEHAHLLVTHTHGFSRALLEKLVPAVREARWLEWELGVPAPRREHPPPQPRIARARRVLARPLAARPTARGLEPVNARPDARSAPGHAGDATGLGPAPVTRRHAPLESHSYGDGPDRTDASADALPRSGAARRGACPPIGGGSDRSSRHGH